MPTWQLLGSDINASCTHPRKILFSPHLTDSLKNLNVRVVLGIWASQLQMSDDTARVSQNSNDGEKL